MSRVSLFLAFIAALTLSPAPAKAFNFTQTHSIWQEPAHIQSSPPSYVGPVVPGIGPFFYTNNPVEDGTFSSYQALCASQATQAGYSSTDSFYCVYDAELGTISFGVPCFGTACSPGAGGVPFYQGFIYLYPASSIQTTSYSSLASQLNNAWDAWFADMNQPVPTSPVVCPRSETYVGGFASPRGFFPANSNSADRCNIYRNAAPPTPPAATASISASPASIIAGSNSTLTWSSTNATSCTGTNFSTGGATSGTVSVAPGSTTTYSVQCTGPGGTSPVQQATVTVIFLSDLTTDTPPTLSATAGQQVTLSVTVRNTSSTGTGQPFPAMLLRSDTIGGPETIVRLFKDGTALGIPGGFPGNYAEAATGTYTPASAGTFYYRLCADLDDNWTGRITELNEGNNCSGWGTVTVSAAPADLTAGSVWPTTVPATQPTQIRTTLTNLGTAGTGTTFPILIQVQGLFMVQGVSDTALAAGASGEGYASWNFGLMPGTYQVRACANYNSVWVPLIPESNFNNNCGPWTTVTAVTPAPTGTLSCTVSNPNPPPNTSVTYTVTPANGATGPYTWNDTQGGSYGTSASISRLIPGTGPYVMQVSGQNVASQPVSCPTVSGVCANPSASITASKTRVPEGETVTISWAASGVDASCTVSGPGVSQTIPGNSCVIPNGSATPTITAQSVYRISCDSGESTAEVIVNVIPKFTEF